MDGLVRLVGSILAQGLGPLGPAWAAGAGAPVANRPATLCGTALAPIGLGPSARAQ